MFAAAKPAADRAHNTIHVLSDLDVMKATSAQALNLAPLFLAQVSVARGQFHLAIKLRGLPHPRHLPPSDAALQNGFHRCAQRVKRDNPMIIRC